ncbi:DUF3558 domain-containing protein [Amycolatopsis alba DSM 44262]|uniref:DUF3558 domain-containing protein n=2 Tax=Amycolatopsis alba TaxID=76020 RepID=A0A229R789_AMYAL|nr:DUF3558 domain-containing protein [Amycolatopsis alba DSM 44262]
MTKAAKCSALAAGIAVLLGACATGDPTDTVSQTPSSAPASSNSPNTSLPYAGAPKVTNPLPASVLSGDPCSTALTPGQVKQAIGVEVPGKPNNLVETVGNGCTWANSATLGQILVTYVTKTHDGLSGVYKNSQPKNPIWRPLADIQGFPAVAYSNNKDQDCTVTIGIADDLSVDVGGFLGDGKRGKADSCEVTAQMAGLVVSTLKQRAGA